MLLSEAFLSVSTDDFSSLVRGISIGKLKTYQMYETLKTRAHLARLNTEGLRKAIPRLRARLEDKDEDLAKDLAQAMLLNHMDLVLAVLGFLGIPHENGFFAKGLDASQWLTSGWQERVHAEFHGKFPEPALLLYINHLAWELDKTASLFQPGGTAPAPPAA
ncbi:MAG: hypothetical protein IT159_01210 [Bryobacterales bacterium]|nr:hypothetical protein [Bryobacterales bacterium]